MTLHGFSYLGNKTDHINLMKLGLLLSQEFSAVRGGEVLIRAKRNDTCRIDVFVGDVVMPLDVIEVHGAGDTAGLIKVFEIAEEVGVVDDSPDVALEMAVVDGVESHERDE